MVVAAATPVHVPLAILTIEHGIATVVDKPLGVLTTEIEYLIQLAVDRNVLFSTFQNRRWDGDFLTVKRLLSTGTLGEIYRFESRFEWLSPRPRPAWKTETDRKSVV